MRRGVVNIVGSASCLKLLSGGVKRDLSLSG